MSTKKTTTTDQTQTQNQSSSFQNQYNPASLSTYNALLPGWQSNMQQYMTNPLQSTFFNQRQQLSNMNNQQMNQTANSNVLQRANRLASGDTSAFINSQLNQNSRALSANNANSFLGNLMYSSGVQQQATNAAMNYRPLQTGGSSKGSMTGTMHGSQVETTGGLGTWLPQLAGAAIGGLTGGLGGLVGGATSGLFRGGDPSALSNSINANNSFISNPGFNGTYMDPGNSLQAPNFWTPS